MTTDVKTQPAFRPALLALAAYSAFDLGLPFIHVPARGLSLWLVALLVMVPTAVFMLLQLWLARSLVGLRPRPVVCAALFAVAVLLWLGVQTQFWHLYPLAHMVQGHPLTPPQRLVVNCHRLLLGLSITLACTYLGILLSPIVREANILLPVALVAMPIDYLGAMTSIGFTQNMVTHHPGIVQAISVPVPSVRGLPIYPLIGPGDVLFIAFFFAVILRLGMNDRATFWWMYGLLTITMLIVISPYGINVAALIPMGLAVLIANWRFFRLQRSEAFAVLYAGGLVIALVGAFYLYSHRHFFHH